MENKIHPKIKNAEFVGDGLYVEKGAKYVRQRDTFSKNTAGDGEDVFQQN